MENAVDALKIAFAVFVFMLGITVLFSISAQAQQTAKILISETDKTKYYNYYSDDDVKFTVDENENRIVTMQNIIPVLYRYSQENYGVTIVDKLGKIVARFDLDTEAICNNWFTVSDYNKYKFMSETANTYKKVNVIADKITGNTKVDWKSIFDEDNKTEVDFNYKGELTKLTTSKMETLFTNWYEQHSNTSGTIRRNYYCYWLGNSGYTSQRIDSDLSRNRR